MKNFIIWKKELYYSKIRNIIQEDKDFLINVAFLELTNKDGYIELMNLIKYFSFKELQNEEDSFRKDMLIQTINMPIKFHEFSEEFKEYIFKEAKKLSETNPKLSLEEKIELQELSKKANLFVSTLV